MDEEDKPVTLRKLEAELERFRIRLETERLEKQCRDWRYIHMILAILMVMTIYFLILYALLKWQLAP
jgi:hypothetical protein